MTRNNNFTSPDLGTTLSMISGISNKIPLTMTTKKKPIRAGEAGEITDMREKCDKKSIEPQGNQD
jgi:hypothetical protein